MSNNKSKKLELNQGRPSKEPLVHIAFRGTTAMKNRIAEIADKEDVKPSTILQHATNEFIDGYEGERNV